MPGQVTKTVAAKGTVSQTCGKGTAVPQKVQGKGELT